MSSSRQRRACKFYPQGRCRDGDRCRFSHDGSSPSNSQQRGAAYPRGEFRGSPTPQSTRDSAQPSGSGRAPRGNCDFFWNTGQCTRGFECTFRHVRQTPHSSAADQPPPASEHRDTLDFTSVEGLAYMNHIPQETHYQSTPLEAHNAIKRFTRDNFSFSNGAGVQDMVAFVKVLASVDRRNTSWNSDNAQAFLEMLVKGNGLDRIREILRHTEVSQRAGLFNTLSFQRGYFPIFQFLASDLILKSTLHHNINALYTALNDTFNNVYDVVTRCMDGMISSGSWKDPTPGLPPAFSSNLSGVVIFETISTVLRQFFLRFKGTILIHSKFVHLVEKLATWFDMWCATRTRDPYAFDDYLELGLRNLTEAEMRRNIERLQEIVRREHATIEAKRKPFQPTSLTTSDKNQALLARLWQTYNPPGNLREHGLPRHDNDAVNIADIRIIPTHQELLSDARPYLPFNTDFPGAPHHCAEGTMEKHLDIQFRLLREELIAPMRESINVLREDFNTIAARRRTRQPPPQLTQIEEVIRRNGGMYRTSGRNSVVFQVYTNVEFSPLEAQRRGFTVGLVIDSPAGDARNAEYKRRQDYWKRSKRLASGSLVGLVIVQNNQLYVSLGNISSSTTEIAESARVYDDRVEIRVQFFDPEVEMKALRREKVGGGSSSVAVLIDNSIMYESLRPFLETLQSMEPTSIPFRNLISQKSRLDSVEIQPPRYAATPRFRFNLECVAKGAEYIHPLDATNPQSILRARRQLVDSSGLDPSQCEAMVDVLTREVALIQGPPGTGKSFTGKEILRVLFANKIRPVVLIAFTNHALDHMLRSVLDAKITERFVRIGSRSSDERISEYTLDKLEKQSEGTLLDRSVGNAYREMKELEKQMRNILHTIQLPQVSWSDVQIHLENFWPEHLTSFLQPPFWVDELSKQVLGDPEEEETSEWTTVQRKKGKSQQNVTIDSIYSFWKYSQDIQFIRPPAVPNPDRRTEARRGQRTGNTGQQDEQERLNYRKRMETFFGRLGYAGSVPPIPEGSRGISDLLQYSNIWSFSSDERLGLATFWEEAIRSVAYNANLAGYDTLRKEYECACKKYNDIKDESRRRLLSRTDLIGCTTNGAAKLTSLLTTVAPKVLLVEEAGQVLEAHILSSLVPSVQHLICIGDPQQLRPNLANYNLSMDSDRGRELYKFDRSLMERLADNGFPMSQINVQRRMRPSISHHIRNILYPRLEDHDRVAHYPPVKGMQKDVFFFTHTNKENSAEDSVSKSNAFEVKMIVELVKYFLKQDAYNAPGDIAVLCAYLGQLQKVRSALKDLRISISLDERDANDLVRQGMVDESSIEEVVVSRHIRLGTVDVFQGDEAKIVIVSLVRNSGTFEADGAPIGFLKSSNRINVALSRAQHGMYIFGNAANLRQNETWRVIIDEMEQNEQLGFALPIVCPRHPDEVSTITQPHEFARQAPEGGCLLPCGHRMGCGHICPSVCHSDRDNHRSIKCNMPCIRTPCPRAHPCPLFCSDECGPCNFPLYDVKLPCGHMARYVLCHQYDDLRSVECTELVEKNLPHCEHSVTVACSTDPVTVRCMMPCGGILDCCGRTCKSECNECLAKSRASATGAQSSTAHVYRSVHKEHPCDRPLYCQHQCGLDCSKEHECTTFCRQSCRQRCSHHKCIRPCGEDCAPCAEACEWVCPHFSCPVLCGSICARLPCDMPCSNTLPCGHPCPSICGEPCSLQKCVKCLDEADKTDIVDFIMQRTLAEVADSDDICDRLITLECGHMFTVETLDGHCHMSDYYEIDMNIQSYVAMKAPPVEFQSPPTCPTCRNTVTARRYGRVTKRANLDILEQNVASNMAHSLEDVGPSLAALATTLPELQENATKIPFEKAPTTFDELRVEKRLNLLTERPNEVMPPTLLTQNAMQTYHGLSSSEEGKAWNQVIRGLQTAYKKVASIARTRSAHTRAYEQALSTLYRQEFSRIAMNSTTGIKAPEQVALNNVHKMLGQPPPKADVRYYVEAFLLSIEIRFMLGQIALSRIDALKVTSNDAEVHNHHHLWSSFVDFLYHACEVDCRKAIKMAEASSSSRLAARSATMLFRAEFERFRFAILEKRKDHVRAGTLTLQSRLELVQELNNRTMEWKKFMAKAEQAYLRSRPSQSTNEIRSERDWFRDNCGAKFERVFDELSELRLSLERDTFYQSVSLAEKEDIVKALAFTHRGHFYNCPNGHPFVITECGGAMEASQCPECGATIGGTNHTLDASNTRAREFEEIAGRQGVARSPWGWVAGA